MCKKIRVPALKRQMMLCVCVCVRACVLGVEESKCTDNYPKKFVECHERPSSVGIPRTQLSRLIEVQPVVREKASGRRW